MGKKQKVKIGKNNLGSVAAGAPDVAGQANMATIKPIDLSLHGDAIDHWQDEPDAPRKQKAAAVKKPERRSPRDAGRNGKNN